VDSKASPQQADENDEAAKGRRTTPAVGQEPGSKRVYRILMIAPTSFFADYGCHVRILEEARALQGLGHAVTIATYHSGGDAPGLDIRRTVPIPWRRNWEVGSSRHKIVFDVLLGLKTLSLLASRRYDVIHAHLHEGALIGLVLGRVFRVPVVFDFQGSLTGEMIDHRFLKAESHFRRFLLWLETRLDRTARVVLTSSIHARNLLVDKFGCDPSRICPLPDCVNTETFKPAWTYSAAELATLRADLGIPADRRLVVYLGLLVEYQGIDLLLEAMSRVLQRRPDAHLLLMGFPRVDFYSRRAVELGIGGSVTFTGRMPYQQAPAYVALGDVAVAPKQSETEGSGKLLNYMAVGLPAVAFDTPVAREYLGQDGLFAAPGDVDSLAENLYNALFPVAGSEDLLRRMGQRLRQRAVQHFGVDLLGRQLADVYRRLLGGMIVPLPAQQERPASCD
jgi:glycosyltransferase involved in cell wall biosynthesis